MHRPVAHVQRRRIQQCPLARRDVYQLMIRTGVAQATRCRVELSQLRLGTSQLLLHHAQQRLRSGTLGRRISSRMRRRNRLRRQHSGNRSQYPNSNEEEKPRSKRRSGHVFSSLYEPASPSLDRRPPSVRVCAFRLFKETSMPTRSQQGDIAETEFLARAPPKRGSRSAAPYGNSCRYDAILDNGIDCCRVQVKSTSYQVRKGVYFVRFGRSLGHAYCEQKRRLRFRGQL